MSDIDLATGEFSSFTVPHALCAAGEFQYLVGQASIVLAAGLRLRARVTETTAEFALSVAADDQRGVPETVGRWTDALRAQAVDTRDDLDGLAVELRPAQTGMHGLVGGRELLLSPAAATALTCATKAHRGNSRVVGSSEVADCAGALLQTVAGEMALGRYYAECLTCAEGGACYVAPMGESLNAQLLLPPASLILGLAKEPAPELSDTWRKVVRSAVEKLGPAVVVALAQGDGGMQRLFDLAAGQLTERETTLLYGLMRVREMIADHVERLGRQMLDHDLLAELCDEESAILQDYFDFPVGDLGRARRTAAEAGALGSKFTYAPGGRPAILIVAPGRRDEVLGALAGDDGGVFLSVDIDAAGVADDSESPGEGDYDSDG